MLQRGIALPFEEDNSVCMALHNTAQKLVDDCLHVLKQLEAAETEFDGAKVLSVKVSDLPLADFMRIKWPDDAKLRDFEQLIQSPTVQRFLLGNCSQLLTYKRMIAAWREGLVRLVQERRLHESAVSEQQRVAAQKQLDKEQAAQEALNAELRSKNQSEIAGKLHPIQLQMKYVSSEASLLKNAYSSILNKVLSAKVLWESQCANSPGFSLVDTERNEILKALKNIQQNPQCDRDS